MGTAPGTPCDGGIPKATRSWNHRALACLWCLLGMGTSPGHPAQEPCAQPCAIHGVSATPIRDSDDAPEVPKLVLAKPGDGAAVFFMVVVDLGSNPPFLSLEEDACPARCCSHCSLRKQALVVPWNKTSPDFPPCPRGEKGKPKGTAQGTAGGWQEQRNLLAFCIWEEKVKNAPGTQQQLLLASSAHPAGTQDLGFDPKEGDEEASSLPAERSTDGSRRPSSFFIF